MVLFVAIHCNGSRLFNDSQRGFLFSPVFSHVQPSTLGRYFLTSAYLMVNHDAETFTLWQANPSTTSLLAPLLGEKTNTEACGATVRPKLVGLQQPAMSLVYATLAFIGSCRPMEAE